MKQRFREVKTGAHSGQIKSSGKRPAKRQSRIGIAIVIAAMLVVVAYMGIRTLVLKERSDRLALNEALLEQEIEDAEKKRDQLEEKEKYMETSKYVEDEAKDKLGLVYPDEIVIEPREEE